MLESKKTHSTDSFVSFIIFPFFVFFFLFLEIGFESKAWRETPQDGPASLRLNDLSVIFTRHPKIYLRHTNLP